MQIASFVFWEKLEKYSEVLSAKVFTQHTKH